MLVCPVKVGAAGANRAHLLPVQAVKRLPDTQSHAHPLGVIVHLCTDHGKAAIVASHHNAVFNAVLVRGVGAGIDLRVRGLVHEHDGGAAAAATSCSRRGRDSGLCGRHCHCGEENEERLEHGVRVYE